MSFDLTRLNRYLPDDAEDTLVAGTTVNTYAPVAAITTTSITIDNAKKISGDYRQFTAGNEIFIHVSASKAGAKTHLGYWTFAEITAVSGDTLTLDRDITADIPARLINDYYLQALTVPFFLSTADSPLTGDIPVPAFDINKFCGGIIVLKAETLYMNWNKINLTDKGIPPANKSLRPWFDYETQGKLDTNKYAGWENAMLLHRLPLNAGDGAALIYTTTGGSITDAGTIGNPIAKGVKFCRGASDSPSLPNNVTNIGGSTALIINRRRSNSVNYARWACKYRSANATEGQGLGARMFASYTTTPGTDNFNDGGLYAHLLCHHDLPNIFKMDTARLFGDGTFGNVTDTVTASKQLNNYALITTKSNQASYKTSKINYTRKTTTGLAPIQAGALVLIEIFNSVTGETVSSTICSVLADNGSTLTLGKSVDLGANRTGMVVSIPQFKNFTLDGANKKTPKYTDGIGGIFAIACTGTCDLSTAKIMATNKGGVALSKFDPAAFERPAILPLGAGNGSILILAKNIKMSTETRLGMIENSGNKLGGRGSNGSIKNGVMSLTTGSQGGGYRGQSVEDSSNIGGYGGGGGTGIHNGGYCSNGTRDADISNAPNQGLQGAHILIIADKITNFCIDAISTGGTGSAVGTHGQGGAGYGGGGAGNGAGGGYRGGGAGDFGSGGAAGYAYIYCNTAVNQLTDGIVLPE